MQRDSAALLDIRSAAHHILNFTAGLEFETFAKVVEVHSAVLYQFIIMGEAAGRLSDAFRDQHPIAPWRRIVGLRNILTHRYDAVDLHQVWQIVQNDLPALLQAIHPLLPSPEDSG
jgi:uncharacterized protein with HEPN domain